MDDVEISIEVNTISVDEAIKKVDELIDKLKMANSLVNELANTEEIRN